MKVFTIPATLTAPRTARSLMTRFGEQQGIAAHVVADAVLLISELTGNALLHARSEARIRLSHDVDTLRVEVSDDSEQLPRMSVPSVGATGGRGVFILEALAASWGATVRTDPPPGKTVWFELRTQD